ncbi:NACHT and WD repeat domain-containing protein 1 [Mizuhopecten yessoensis]|uniref:NACHT and WD repeat domain-containing protein 1 n=1 Tax=Mizuhopecten yessoensis TaxID=6573 RepID=A0A210R7H2_MIZYE|nr:NACHT and WD repeat domain-containing protein 1 [Mizuhopecten yessoensis]
MYRQYLYQLSRLSGANNTGVEISDRKQHETTSTEKHPLDDKSAAPSVPPSPPPPPPPPPPLPGMRAPASVPGGQPMTSHQHMFDQLDEMTRMINDTESMLLEASKKAMSKLPKVHPSLLGDMTMSIPTLAKIVRIFTSSTFTDTKFERNIWMSEAYPRVKAFCQEQGYEFQVVDMRWGVRDEASDDHSTTDLCLKELEMCQKLSTGPNFVVVPERRQCCAHSVLTLLYQQASP